MNRYEQNYNKDNFVVLSEVGFLIQRKWDEITSVMDAIGKGEKTKNISPEAIKALHYLRGRKA